MKPVYTEVHIAQLPDSDNDNEIIDEYDEITRQGTQQPKRGPFQNYMVYMFLYFHSVVFFESEDLNTD
jgi:hypothetical protein